MNIQLVRFVVEGVVEGCVVEGPFFNEVVKIWEQGNKALLIN